jgi:hypothetical protein
VSRSGIGRAGSRRSDTALPYVARRPSVVLASPDQGSVADDRTGGGTLTTSASLAGAGRKAAAGTGSVAGSASLAGAGRKADAGGGSVILAATLTGSGTKAEAVADAREGGGTLDTSPVLAGSGTKATAAGGTLAATATLTGSGTKAEEDVAVSFSGQLGIGMLAAFTLGTKDLIDAREGGGTLELVAGFAGDGTAAEVPVRTSGGAGKWSTSRYYPPVRHASGGGVLVLRPVLSGGGVAWEPDDDLLLELLELAA